MNHLTKLYQNKAIQLQEQIDFLEAQLKYMAEDAPPSIFAGTGKGQQTFSDSQLEDQMYRHKRTGMFGAKIEDDKQNQEYKDAKAELDRRRGAKPEPKPTTSPANVSGTNRSAPDVQRDSTYTKPKTPSTRPTPDTLDLYNLRKKEDSGLQGELNKGFGTDWLGKSGKDNNIVTKTKEPRGGDAISLNKNVEATKTIQDPIGMDPKGLLLGVGGGLYAGNKIGEYINRQRTTEIPKGTYSTPEGKVVTPQKSRGTVAERAAMGRDLLRARMAQRPVSPPIAPQSGTYNFDLPAQAEYMQNPVQWNKNPEKSVLPNTSGRKKPYSKAGLERAKNTPLEGSFGPAATGEPPVQPDSYSTPEGKVVTPQAAKGSVVGKVGRGVGRVGVDLAGMIAAGDMGERVAKLTGAGKTATEIAGTVASIAPMAAGVGTNAAIATGYVAGRLIDKGMEASGAADVQRKYGQRFANWMTADQRKGVSSLEDAQRQAKDISDTAKLERSTDIGKGFASPEEAAEFAKKMKNPQFKREHEYRMSLAQRKELENKEGGFAVQGVEALPDWVNAIGEYDPLGKATNYAIENIPGAKWATGKAGEAIHWLSK